MKVVRISLSATYPEEDVETNGNERNDLSASDNVSGNGIRDVQHHIADRYIAIKAVQDGSVFQHRWVVSVSDGP